MCRVASSGGCREGLVCVKWSVRRLFPWSLVARKASCLIPRADLPSFPIDHLTALYTFQNLFRYAPSSKSCRISSTFFPSPVSVTFSSYPSKTKFAQFAQSISRQSSIKLRRNIETIVSGTCTRRQKLSLDSRDKLFNLFER